MHVIAYYVTAPKTYRLDLYPYGVRPEWKIDCIWDVAQREMQLAWGTPCTAIALENVG